MLYKYHIKIIDELVSCVLGSMMLEIYTAALEWKHVAVACSSKEWKLLKHKSEKIVSVSQ